MRITNKMMSNNSLVNINGNKLYLDKLNTQMATEKKITRPSDDPIVAIRALRLRSDLSQVTQYYGANVPDAQAWVSVTQKAIDSTMDMLSSMRALCDQGANGTNTTSEREKIYETLKGYKDQIYLNGNASNAGRTVFTGYRTGEKLTFTEDTEADYRGIADTFNAKDVHKNTYIEGGSSLAEISSLGVSVGTCTVDLTTDPDAPTITIDGTVKPLEKDTDGSYKPVTVDDKKYTVSKEGKVRISRKDGKNVGKSYKVSSDGKIYEINDETNVKEDKVNRIRLSYDNISGSVRKGVTEGFNGAQSGNSTDYSYAGYYNDDGSLNMIASPKLNTDTLVKLGLKQDNTKQELMDCFSIYPIEYFCPKSFVDGIIRITENTYSIHHFDASWLSKEALEETHNRWKRKQKRAKQKARRAKAKSAFVKVFGENTYKKIRGTEKEEN